MKVVVPPTSAALLAVSLGILGKLPMHGKIDVHVRIDEAGKEYLPVAQ